MQPVHFRKSAPLLLSKAGISFLLVIVLAACGSSTGVVSSAAQSHSGNAVNKPVTARSLEPNPANISIDRGGLRIQSYGGIECPRGDQFVLASDRKTYNQDEIAQIRSQLNLENYGPKGGPPPTLGSVLGGSMSPIPGQDASLHLCGATLNLTNTGSTPVQISSVAVQLEARPQQNTYQYRLIDICSVQSPPHPGCYPPSGSGATCSIYDASIQLGMGEKGTIYSTTPTGEGNNCGILTITQSAPVELHLNFSLAASIPQNLIYSIVPVFTVDTAQGKQTLQLPQMGRSLAFANTNQFSCYALQGTTFVRVQSPSLSTNFCR